MDVSFPSETVSSSMPPNLAVVPEPFSFSRFWRSCRFQPSEWMFVRPWASTTMETSAKSMRAFLKRTASVVAEAGPDSR